jgi:hypothetical protein
LKEIQIVWEDYFYLMYSGNCLNGSEITGHSVVVDFLSVSKITEHKRLDNFKGKI